MTASRWVVLGTVASGSLALAPVRASAQPIAWSPAIGAELSVGDGVAFGLGGDFRLAFLTDGRLDSCSPNAHRTGVGPFVQAYWLTAGGARVAGGAHAGTTVGSPASVLDADLGVAYQSSLGKGRPGGVGLQVGGSLGFLSAFALTMRGTLPFPGEAHRPHVTFGAELRFPGAVGPYFGGGCPIEGRPLRLGESVVLADARLTWREERRAASRAGRAGFDADEAAALGAAWLDDARAECASVPAFLALARDLARLGCPDLAHRALGSAREEVAHTGLCAALGGALTGADVALAVPAVPASRDASRAALLERLAIESYVDGCLGEGAAAARARRAAANAARGGQAVVARAKRRVARDEARHAELAWDVLAFCLAQGGPALRDELADRALAPPPREIAASASADLAADLGHAAATGGGLLGPAETSASADETHASSQVRLVRLLTAA